jgi:hypothetical protein
MTPWIIFAMIVVVLILMGWEKRNNHVWSINGGSNWMGPVENFSSGMNDFWKDVPVNRGRNSYDPEAVIPTMLLTGCAEQNALNVPGNSDSQLTCFMQNLDKITYENSNYRQKTNLGVPMAKDLCGTFPML